MNQGPAVFWQELGKTIAAFGYLERTLASTCYALLATPENARVFLDKHDERSHYPMVKRIVQSQVDPMHGLTSEFDRVLREAGRVPHTVREDLVSELRELRPWRNALCHGAWLSVDEAGSGHLEHLYLEDGVPVAFEPKLALQDLPDVRARTVDVTFRIAEAASIASAGLPLAAMPRKYVPRNGLPNRNSKSSQSPSPPSGRFFRGPRHGSGVLWPRPGVLPKQRIAQNSRWSTTALATGFSRS